MCTSEHAPNARRRLRSKLAGGRRPPPIAQQLQQLRREHDEAIPLPLALLAPQRDALAAPRALDPGCPTLSKRLRNSVPDTVII
jgi:hypothetical protein